MARKKEELEKQGKKVLVVPGATHGSAINAQSKGTKQETFSVGWWTKELMLEERKVKALEKIANVLDALTLWFEDIDKEEWSNRLQWYLSETYEKYIKEDDKK